ncbi:hypothetical protein [Helicobacter cetorum]|nr:hypothetical protein [Helicobacter cetorum]
MQLTIIGWIPAMVWAIVATSSYLTDKKIKEAISDMQKEKSK